MTLTVSPQIERRIQKQMENGQYVSLDHLLDEALAVLETSHQEVTMEHFLASIDEALKDVEKGLVYTSEEARARLAKLREERSHA